MHPAMIGKAGCPAQAMEDLDQVAVFQRPPAPVGEQKRLRHRRRVASQPPLEHPRGGRPDERHPILAALAGTHEEAPVQRPPVFDNEPEHLAGTQATIGQDKHKRAVPDPLKRIETCLHERAELVVGGNVRQAPGRAHGEAAKRRLLEHTRFDAPAEEGLEGPVRLVLTTRAQGLQPNEEPADLERPGRGERRDTLADPPLIDAKGRTCAALDALREQEGLDGRGEGVSRCFFCGYLEGRFAARP